MCIRDSSIHYELVQLPQERGERLARPCRREDQSARAARDRRPAFTLRRARVTQRLAKPGADDRVERLERGRNARGHLDRLTALGVAPRVTSGSANSALHI